MAYDEGLAELLRADLAEIPGIEEKRMFGGLAFMKDGHMLCGVHKGGGMFRVGKPRHAEALAIEGQARCNSPAARWAASSTSATRRWPTTPGADSLWLWRLRTWPNSGRADRETSRLNRPFPLSPNPL